MLNMGCFECCRQRGCLNSSENGRAVFNLITGLKCKCFTLTTSNFYTRADPLGKDNGHTEFCQRCSCMQCDRNIKRLDWTKSPNF